MAWTDLRVELLKKLWADGLSASQCASEMGGVTRCGVIGKVSRLGLVGRKQAARANAKQKRKPRGRRIEVRTRLLDGALPPVQIQAPVLLSSDYLCSLFELNERTCRWPCWPEGTPFDEQRYCGIPSADVYASRPYCGEHSRLVYAPTLPRKERPYRFGKYGERAA